MSINLKIERYIEKGVNEEVIIHNSIYIFHSFRGHKKDLFHLNYNTLCIIYLHLFYYSKHFNYSETLPYCVLIIYLTVLTFLYISCYSHALNKLNCSAVIIYFIMFLFYYMQCIREILFLLHLINSFTTLHFFASICLRFLGEFFSLEQNTLPLLYFFGKRITIKTYFAIPFYQITMFRASWEGFRFLS